MCNLIRDGDAESASRNCAASATAAEPVPAVDAGPAASASDSATARQHDAGAGMAPPQGGAAAARQKPASGPVVPGHVTLAAQRVCLSLCGVTARLESVSIAHSHTSIMQASI